MGGSIVMGTSSSRSHTTRVLLACLVATPIAFFCRGDGVLFAQAGGAAAPKPKTAPSGAATAPKVEANLLQLMRGIVYPASNVIFAAQEDFSKQPVPPDASTSPNPLTTTYGGWQAVENAGLAIAESANLILMPGRMCSSGRLAPVQRADWIKDVQKLREAGRAAYQAAKKKDVDAMVDVSGTISDACSTCHDVYREKKGGEKDRCLP
jgi:hypothetical protein